MTRREAAEPLALFAGLTVLGLVLPGVELLGLNQHLFLALNVMALNFCLGLGGQASMAQAAFCGLGAYASVMLGEAFPGLAPAWPPLAVVLCAGLAALVSMPLERLGEGFLAMATLGLGLIFSNSVLTFESVTGGSNGLVVNAPLQLPFFGPMAGDRASYFLFLAVLAAAVAVFYSLRDSRLGRALAACRDDPLAATACGVNRVTTRAVSFGLGGAISGAAGVIQGHYSGYLSPGQYDMELSLRTLLFLVIGGPGRPLRPILAVLVLETLLAKAHFLGEARTLVHGLLLGLALVVGVWRERAKSRLVAKPGPC